LSGIKFTSC